MKSRDRTYTFSATNNAGRITQMTDAISGETIDYRFPQETHLGGHHRRSVGAELLV